MTGLVGRIGAEPIPFEAVGDLPEGERVIVTGSDDERVAVVGVRLLWDDREVVLHPTDPPPEGLPLSADRLFDTDGPDRTGPAPATTVEWDLVCYTSGSTGTPRPIGVRRDQLETTAEWYREAYGLTSDSVIISSLPSTYNFSFIAGAFTASVVGCTYLVATDVPAVVECLEEPPADADRVIGLTNPVVLEAVAAREPTFDDRVLLDSGGAPLSEWAVRWFREEVADLREGYGLTETCSLTHFDDDGTPDSVGTVGRAREGVETDLLERDGKSVVSVTTPNAGVELHPDGTAATAWDDSLVTDDLGVFDDAGRLRIVGRDADREIAGHWPRDTLDAVGPLLGPRCAIVRHLPGPEVVVRLWTAPEDPDAVRRRIASTLSLDPTAVQIRPVEGELLHSQKLPFDADG